MGKGKVNNSKEGKFRASLNSWGEDIDNRPFIRVKEDLERDEKDYERKHELIKKEKLEVSKITGDKLEDIHIWGQFGLNSQEGFIKEWTPIKEVIENVE